jgi:hypothetical protein
MSGKRKRQEAKANQKEPDHSPLSSVVAPDSFQANVFTWTGPGVENIFIDLEPVPRRKHRRLWKDGVADNPREAPERADNNG